MCVCMCVCNCWGGLGENAYSPSSKRRYCQSLQCRFQDIPAPDSYLYSFNPCKPFSQLSCTNATVSKHTHTHTHTHARTHARTHVHTRTHAPTHPQTSNHSLTHSLARSLTHSLTHSLTRALAHSSAALHRKTRACIVFISVPTCAFVVVVVVVFRLHVGICTQVCQIQSDQTASYTAGDANTAEWSYDGVNAVVYYFSSSEETMR